MRTEKLYSRYGGMQPGIYNIVGEGHDYYKVKWRGSIYCVPLKMFEYTREGAEYMRKQERQYEEVYDEDYFDYADYEEYTY